MSAFRQFIADLLSLRVIWEVEIDFDNMPHKRKKFLIVSRETPNMDLFPHVGDKRSEGIVTGVSICIVQEGWL